MKQKKQFKRYIPALLMGELNKLTYGRKDDLYVIIDLIHRKEIYFKSDYQNKYGFTEIPLQQFKELVPSCVHLKNGIDFLVDNKLLMKNNYYSIGVKSKSYRIPREYLGKTVPVIIEDVNINKRISAQIVKNKRSRVKNLEFAKTAYFKTFKVDIDGATQLITEKIVSEIKRLCFNLNINFSQSDIIDIIECRKGHEKKRLTLLLQDEKKEIDNIIHRYMVYSTRINAINDGFLFFRRNKTNGRLDSNLTSLPSFLRPFLISDEKLMNLDIKNSQPYFLYTLIWNNPDINQDELKLYSELVINGKFYEYLIEQYKKHTGYDRYRNQMKDMLFKIFYSKTTSYSNYKSFFGTIFPTIMEYINQTNFDKHNTLSIQLQSKESFTILDIIMPLLEAQNIRPYTIHDSFICKESEAIQIKEIFNSKLIELYGRAPAMHLDFLIVESEDDDIISSFDSLIEDIDSQQETEN
ncbi:MAG: hypothetical protein V4565_08980 [Bacteroidota bacterium]